MREVITAEHAGFCFGVERAVRMAMDASEGDLPVYTLGPVVHNEEVLKTLSDKGVRVVTEEELSALPEGILIIRAHGISKALSEKLLSLPLHVQDATCPFVKKIHRIVAEHAALGEWIIIVGDPDHPEVRGIMGWAGEHVFTVNSEKEWDLMTIPLGQKYCIVSQTTFNDKKFKIIVENIIDKGYNVVTVNTICNATRDRQEEARALSERADVMIVIGDPASSNSQKLYSICKERCNHTYFIQTADDLHCEWYQDVKCVGITAGASTPKNIIQEVQTNVRKF
ncbi:MAG: 4-hydroxy-3-methylbut-2-enyl diphosphate reductase [Lachnospiraceae bacterium]|nr:4-hydroxy-3-methylbut-2-enyl diphosphate reductase [Lachnospiraceae bacterium]